MGGWRAHHYPSARGDEIDLVFVRGGRPQVAVEVTRSTAPSVSAGYRRAISDLGVEACYPVRPQAGGEPYVTDSVTVIGLTDLVHRFRVAQP